MLKITEIISRIRQIPTVTAVVGGFCLLFFAVGMVVGAPVSASISATLANFGMWGLFALAMVPTIRAGIGPNFALPVGAISGTCAMVLTAHMDFTSASFLLVSAIFAILFGCIMGYICGKLINAAPGYEMVVGLFIGFAVLILLVTIFTSIPEHRLIPPHSIRVFIHTRRWWIDLCHFDVAHMLAEFWQFEILGVTFRTGELMVVFTVALVMWIFFKTKAGMGMTAAGSNPAFAKVNGTNVKRNKIAAMMASTTLGAFGSIVHASNIRAVMLIEWPMFIGVFAAAAIFAGGATLHRASIKNAIIGVLLLQGVEVIPSSVFREIFQDSYSRSMFESIPYVTLSAIRPMIILIVLIKGNSFKFRREHDL